MYSNKIRIIKIDIYPDMHMWIVFDYINQDIRWFLSVCCWKM